MRTPRPIVQLFFCALASLVMGNLGIAQQIKAPQIKVPQRVRIVSRDTSPNSHIIFNSGHDVDWELVNLTDYSLRIVVGRSDKEDKENGLYLRQTNSIDVWQTIEFVAQITLAPKSASTIRVAPGNYVTDCNALADADHYCFSHVQLEKPGRYTTKYDEERTLTRSLSLYVLMPLDTVPLKNPPPIDWDSVARPSEAATLKEDDPRDIAVLTPNNNFGSIEDEIARIKGASHETMPTPQSSKKHLGGKTVLSVSNQTEYTLYLYLSGSGTKQVTIPSHSQSSIELVPGDYEVAARVSNQAVIPFYGRQSYGSNTQYSEEFYVETRVGR